MQAQRLDISQQQRLKLSPQLMQSIKLLAMPTAELQEHIAQELEKNPALECKERVRPSYVERFPTKHTVNISASDDHQAFLENIASSSLSLQASLLSQLAETDIPHFLSQMCQRIIQNLDENGFHLAEIHTLFPHSRPDAYFERNLIAALTIIRNLDPIGTACIDFKESLIVQSHIRNDTPPLALDILENNFDLLEKNRAEIIAKQYKIPLSEAAEALDFIRSLEPFPGRICTSERITYIIPDVTIKKNEEGFIAVINEDEIPILRISPIFKKLIKDKSQTVQTRNFAQESIREAHWFMETITQRNHSLLKVVRMIVIMQNRFFEKGPAYLAPLRLQDVAQEIGLHEGTVSRIANGKYIQCEWGIFEIKYFFSTKVTASGKDLSKEAVKLLLKDIIAEKGSISDQKLSDILAERGIFLARRTVAKYRNELIIKPSFERK